MYIARILYPVEVLGPGKRIGIWFCGCPRRCKSCSNPELWEFQDKFKTSLYTIIKLIKGIAQKNDVDGFTITGGEPFLQYESLMGLINSIKIISEDILVYTGYKVEELADRNLDSIAVLIDGQYIEKRNSNVILRGSDNQRVHILNKRYENIYVEYLSKSQNQIQNFSSNDGIISVGIHKPGFIESLSKGLADKGLEEQQ